MKRRHITFECAGETLVGTFDKADARTGLLIVTGGNELRSGPFGSHAELADKIATAGFPVFRFDRRGVGDSSGANASFADSADDIAAACAAFRAQMPALRRIVAYGNCDAASALMLSSGAGFDSLVLANPWTFEPDPEAVDEAAPVEAEAVMSPGAVRAHYLRRIVSLSAWKRLIMGRVEVGKMAQSLAIAVKPSGPPSTLAQTLSDGLKAFEGQVTILIAANDRTAEAFLEHWDKHDPRLRKCPGAGHSFVEPQSRIWLQGQLLGALRALA